MIHCSPKYRQPLLIVILVILLVMTLLPFGMMLMMSQKSNAEILNHFWQLPQQLHHQYWVVAYEFIYPYIINSLIVCVAGVLGTIILSSLSGYVFAHIPFKGKEPIFIMVIALMMLPGILTLIPAFLWFKQFPFVGGNDWAGVGGTGLLDSRLVLIIPIISGGQVFGIYLCRTFFSSMPRDIFDAARIDGASEWMIYLRILLPMSLPVLATLGMIVFVGAYNDYIWPLVAISDNSKQVFAVGVTQAHDEAGLDLAPQMASYVIGALPLILIFIVGMKYYVAGMTRGVLKH